MYKSFFKRFCDIVAATIGLIIASPILLIFIVILTCANGGYPFFFQLRPGKNEHIFRIIKFRTMNNRRDKEGNLLPDAVRLTKIGKFVRSTSIDELPQMINVLKGDMSFIGPRPLLVEYLPLYSKEEARRHEVRPGITGWAQVNGRNVIKLSQKFQLDTWYVDNFSIKIDLKILLITFTKVMNRKDIRVGTENIEQIDDLNFMKKINSYDKSK